MHAAIVISRQGPLFYWNVDHAVGKNGVNKFEDVLFVQWCLYKLVRHAPQQAPHVLDKLKLVGLNGNCNGRETDPLVEGIKALQQSLNLVVDGRVSSVPTGASHYREAGGKSVFLILYPLNATLAQMHPAQWPRIDLMPDFVWQIKDKATAPFSM